MASSIQNLCKKNPLNNQCSNHTESLRERFDRDGYLVLNNFIKKSECETLIRESKRLIQDHANTQNFVVFDTESQQHAQAEYFLESGRNISFFYEKDAFDKNKRLTTNIDMAVNKIGHALHDLNAVFNAFSYQDKFKNLLQQLGQRRPQIVQSMYILKQPKIGDKVDVHQDSSFIYTEPESCIGLWFALEDANKTNGCLWAIPGSNKDKLKQRLIRNGTSTEIAVYDTSGFNLHNAIPLEVEAGTLVVLHGRLAHYSTYNHSENSRHAYALHAIDQDTIYTDDNWLRDTDVKFTSW